MNHQSLLLSSALLVFALAFLAACGDDTRPHTDATGSDSTALDSVGTDTASADIPAVDAAPGSRGALYGPCREGVCDPGLRCVPYRTGADITHEICSQVCDPEMDGADCPNLNLGGATGCSVTNPDDYRCLATCANADHCPAGAECKTLSCAWPR